MKIRTRLEYFLAKIAGVETDAIETMTPAYATGAEEELLEKIAERLDDLGEVDVPENATASKAGLVKQAANVAYAAGEAPTAAEFKALIDALVAAGIMAANA